jgi:hypothetical protein
LFAARATPAAQAEALLQAAMLRPVLHLLSAKVLRTLQQAEVVRREQLAQLEQLVQGTEQGSTSSGDTAVGQLPAGLAPGQPQPPQQQQQQQGVPQAVDAAALTVAAKGISQAADAVYVDWTKLVMWAITGGEPTQLINYTARQLILYNTGRQQV